MEETQSTPKMDVPKKRGRKPKYIDDDSRIEARRAKARDRYQKLKEAGFVKKYEPFKSEEQKRKHYEGTKRWRQNNKNKNVEYAHKYNKMAKPFNELLKLIGSNQISESTINELKQKNILTDEYCKKHVNWNVPFVIKETTILNGDVTNNSEVKSDETNITSET